MRRRQQTEEVVSRWNETTTEDDNEGDVIRENAAGVDAIVNLTLSVVNGGGYQHKSEIWS